MSSFLQSSWQVITCRPAVIKQCLFLFTVVSQSEVFWGAQVSTYSIKLWLPPWRLPISGLCCYLQLWKCSTKCFCGTAGRHWPLHLPSACQAASLWNPTEVNSLTLPSPLGLCRCKAPCLLGGTTVFSSSFCSSCFAVDSHWLSLPPTLSPVWRMQCLSDVSKYWEDECSGTQWRADDWSGLTEG